MFFSLSEVVVVEFSSTLLVHNVSDNAIGVIKRVNLTNFIT